MTQPMEAPRAALIFFFNDTATTEIYTLSLHDALPISAPHGACRKDRSLPRLLIVIASTRPGRRGDRKSTRLNSSHRTISYDVFCLKKKKKTKKINLIKKKKKKKNKKI